MPPPDIGPAFRAVVLSGAYERVHHALVLAATAAALGRPTALFFTMSGCTTVTQNADGTPGWHYLTPTPPHPSAAAEDATLQARGVADLETLLASVVALGGAVLVCEAGLRAHDLPPAALRPDLAPRVAGALTWLAETPVGAQSLVF